MASKDAETVIASYEAVNRRDIASAMEALHEDAEWHESGALPEPDVQIGRDAIGRFLEDFLAQWESFHQEIVDTVVEGERVAVFIHLTAVGRGSSAEVDARYAHVWQMRDGLAARVDAYYDRDEALAAIAP
ncbi:MAG TPA: nuclear transport factor 2 family protein [Solirubrobacterales bacterium]|nr:nuclear transport factor 2 family protein [Solirubrobacterales bacterium]